MAVDRHRVNACDKNILGLKQISAGAILPKEQPTMGGPLNSPILYLPTPFRWRRPTGAAV
jgi:hypothetical protein